MIRTRLAQDFKEAEGLDDQTRLSTLRLICAAIKDRDHATRAADQIDGVSDTEIVAILDQMLKQRDESARDYDEAGQIELAERERAEAAVIAQYMPKPLSETDVRKAIDHAIRETGAQSIRDVGRIMGVLKERYPGRMDFSQACAQVRQALV